MAGFDLTFDPVVPQSPDCLQLLAEAVRIEHARLVLGDGLSASGDPFTPAQKLRAKAFLSNRRADWLHSASAFCFEAGVTFT